jgi:uncharacterized protein (DUF427 family)
MTIRTPSAVDTVGTRIRAYLGDTLVADSRNVLLFRQSPMKIYYCFPEGDIAEGVVEYDSAKSMSSKHGTRTNYSVTVGERRVENAAFAMTEPVEEIEALRGYVALQFSKMDRWFEEEEELIGHPRDPYTRIDVRRSARHVHVELAGHPIIDTHRPFLLLETGLQVRYYIPVDDVDWSYCRQTDTETVCPYKGRARYWSVSAGDTEQTDVLWAYPEPLQDSRPVKDAVGLHHEKLDVWVDGEKLEKEQTYFSK